MQLLPCRYVHAEDRHFEARCKIHYCKTCKKQFASWHPDSMKWWPPCVRRRLYNVLHVGRKSALARTIVDRAVREGPLSAKATAMEWNVRVSQMLSNAEAHGPPGAAEQIRCEFGYLGTKDAQRHADRLTLRVEQTQYAGTINDGLIEFGSSVKELSCPVLEVELDTDMPSWMQHGVGGPAAKVLKPSAVRPGTRSAPADNVMDHAETKHHCFLCSLNGQSPAECAIMAEDGTTYLNGHRKDRKAVVCEWFENNFPAGDSEREGLKEKAKRAKENALQNCRRAKKRPTGAACGTG